MVVRVVPKFLVALVRIVGRFSELKDLDPLNCCDFCVSMDSYIHPVSVGLAGNHAAGDVFAWQ